MSYKKSAVALASLGLLAPIANAAQEKSELNPIVVTAGRFEQNLTELVTDVVVINREQIERSSANTLGELLSIQSGVQMNRDGGAGQPESIYIRGGNSSHTLFLIDGVKIGSATTGAASFENIPLSQIEKIEILKGGASSLYGSDAISGVVQIFTRSSDTAKTSVSAGFGNLNSKEVTASYYSKLENLSFGLSYGQKSSNGINQYSSATYSYNPDRDGFNQKNLLADIKYKDKDLELGYKHLETTLVSKFDSAAWDSSYQNYANFDFRNRHETSTDSIWASRNFLANWNSKIIFTKAIDGLITSPSSTYPDERDSFKTSSNQINWQNNFFSRYGTFVLGYDYLKQSIDSSKVFTMDARTINSYYGGYSVVAGKNILQMNVRQDENSQFGESRTYRLGYAYRLDGQWKLYGSKSTAFKAPSFNDLYFPNTLYVGVGNPNLKPETSTNYEYGISKSGEVYEFGVTHFVSKISNLISWAETAPSSFFYSPSNIGSANISGYEFRAKYKFRSYEFGFNYTAQNPIDALTRNQLIRKAKEFGSVYLTYQSADWRISPIFTVVGKTYDDSSNLRGIPGYGLLGVNVQKKMTQEVSMYLNANNILNKDHNVSITSSSVATGMPFTFMVGLKYQPK